VIDLEQKKWSASVSVLLVEQAFSQWSQQQEKALQP
jgi:hypothetical protein